MPELSLRKANTVKYIVGIGASAGGLEPLQELVSNLPSNMGNMAIIVAQHMSPNYKSMLVDLLKRKTSIPVSEALNGELIEPNKIYTTKPNNDIIYNNGYILLESHSTVGPKPSIDLLFNSIAQAKGIDSIGIVLSGTGTDGAKGIMSIKAAGGLCIVQEPSTAKYEGMPEAALSTDCVDYSLSPDIIGSEIMQLISNPAEREKKRADENLKETSESSTTEKILKLLAEKMGTDFRSYKTSTIFRRLEKRLSESKFGNIELYYSHVRKNPSELDNLFNCLLIGVTSFFRDVASFDEIEKKIEKIFVDKEKDQSIRIWIPGCASGEEAYSIAILCYRLSRAVKSIPVQIFATDIDENALNTARKGIYSKASLENLPDEVLNEFFIKKGENYELVKQIRQMVLFSKHDITSNPPFLKLDLISCRNLLIYFNQSLQTQVIPLFHYALNLNGYLFLGKSETVGTFKTLFSTVDARHKIFQKKNSDNKIMRFSHLKPYYLKKPAVIKTEDKPKEDYTIPEMVKETLYNTFENPYVIIDENMDMIEVYGNVKPYLNINQGAASINIIKLIAKELSIELRAVVTKTIKTNERTEGNIRKIIENDTEHFVRLIVKPLIYSKPNNPFFIVIFEKVKLDPLLMKTREIVYQEAESPKVIELEHELAAVKEHMNTLLEELETANEELQALNEELQSSNEELQASNEELETSNEELQATNEELQIAYTELKSATDEIERQNETIRQSENNVKTLLNTTLQAFILIDKNYKVVTYNETAKQLYAKIFGKQISTGTSYVDLIPPESFKVFHENFQRSLKGEFLSTEEQVKNGNGENFWLSFNFTPAAQSGKENIEFVSLSFLDFTLQKLAETERDRLFNLSVDLFAVINQEGNLTQVNPAWEKILGYTSDELLKKPWKQLIHPDDLEITFRKWQSKKNEDIFRFENRVKNNNGDYLWISWNNIFVKQKGAIYAVGRDITEEKKINDLLRVTNQLAKIGGWEMDVPSKKLFWTTQVYHVHELPPDYNITYKKSLEYFDQKFVSLIENGLKKTIQEGEPFKIDAPFVSAKGREMWVRITAYPIEEKGKIVKLIGTFQDITDLKEAESELVEAKDKAEEMNRLKSNFLSNMSHEIRTPLNGILGIAQLIERKQSDENIKNYCDLILQSGKRLLNTINGILDLSKIESDKFTLKFEEINVVSVILDIKKSLEAIALKKNLFMETNFQQDTIIAYADVILLEHILINIIGNAIKFTENGGITITAQHARYKGNSGFICIVISDTGIGIAKDFIKKIFEPFTQESQGENRMFQGNGLGLSITQKFIQKLNGYIEVKSKKNQGTTFTVYLPTKKD